jgi:hypothetical protein
MKVKGTFYGIPVFYDFETKQVEDVNIFTGILFSFANVVHTIGYYILRFLGFEIKCGFPIKIKKEDIPKEYKQWL